MNPETDPKSVLITGVSRRIGAHLAANLLAQGYRVIGTYRQQTAELAALIEQGLIAVPCELTDPEAPRQLSAALVAATSRLDAIIHNASVWYDDAACARDPAKYTELYHVHVTAPVLITEQLQRDLPAVAQNGQAGRLVVFMTDAHTYAGEADHLHYHASKAAAENAVRSLARRYAPHTRVNAIAPGLILFHPEDSAAYRTERLQQKLLPFEPGAQVIAQTIDYLLACPAINATTITVDSGLR